MATPKRGGQTSGTALGIGDDWRMDFWITIVGLIRRTRVLIPAVVVAVVLGALGFFLTPATYVSSTTMVLTTTPYGSTQSRDASKPTGLTNPMLDFNDSLLTASAILTTVMNTKSVAGQLGVKGSTSMVIDDGRSNPQLLGLNGPFVYVVVKSSSAGESRRVVTDAQKLMRGKLRDWQSDLKAPESTYVSLVDVVPPGVPEASRGKQLQNGLLGLLVGFAGTLGFFYFRLRRGAGGHVEAPAVVAAPDVEAAPSAPRDPVVRDVGAVRWAVAEAPQQAHTGQNGVARVWPEPAYNGNHVATPVTSLPPAPAVEVATPFAVVDADAGQPAASGAAGSQGAGGLPIWPFTTQQFKGLVPGGSEPSPEPAPDSTPSVAVPEGAVGARSGVNGSKPQAGDGHRPEPGPETKPIVLG